MPNFIGCSPAHLLLPAAAALALSAGGCSRAPSASAPGERHLRNVRQLTFGGNNAEAYFSPDGRQLIFQRQEQLNRGCDQQYVMNVDGSGLHRVSNGKGRTTCESSPECPPPADRSQGYVWPLHNFEIYTARADGNDIQRLTHNDAYDAE